jgi:hypothetical protein
MSAKLWGYWFDVVMQERRRCFLGIGGVLIGL